jgi:hypothetical protein
MRVVENIKTKSFEFQVQYKILKLKKAIAEELKETDKFVTELAQKYGKKDEDGNLITRENGSISIEDSLKDEFIVEANKLDEMELQIPDIYFSEDEMSGLGLTLEEVEVFMMFIK